MLKTDIILEFKNNTPKNEKDDLQRTEKWQMKRLGRWTGSAFTKLMTTTRGMSSVSWSENYKILEFGKTALKYIYSNGKERQTGQYIESNVSSIQMRYGTKVEPLILKMFKKYLKENKIKGKIKEVGFKVFSEIKTAGVSSDSILILKSKPIASIEMKACTNWETHYERTFEKTHEQSKDFWQIQSQMMAWKVPLCYYITASPPKNIKKYSNYDGDIMDLYKDFKKEVSINVEVVEKSNIQCNALLKRVFVSEKCLESWKKEKYQSNKLNDIFYNTIEYFKNNEQELDNLIKK